MPGRLRVPGLVAARLLVVSLVGVGLVLAGPVAIGPLTGVASASTAVSAGTAVSASTAVSAGTVASAAPAAAAPGASVTFTVSCASATSASATLAGQSLGLPAQIPMDAVGAAGHFSIEVTLPGGIRPGTYHPRITCDGGTSAPATLRVAQLAAAAGSPASARTGSHLANTVLAAGGLVLIAVGAVAGGIAIRRRGSRRGPAGA